MRIIPTLRSPDCSFAEADVSHFHYCNVVCMMASKVIAATVSAVSAASKPVSKRKPSLKHWGNRPNNQQLANVHELVEIPAVCPLCGEPAILSPSPTLTLASLAHGHRGNVLCMSECRKAYLLYAHADRFASQGADLPCSAVNDNFCDAPNGSDEPGEQPLHAPERSSLA